MHDPLPGAPPNESGRQQAADDQVLPPTSTGPYRSVVVSRGWIFVSAQPPKRDGILVAQGRIGHEVDPEQALVCVKQAASNVLFQIEQAVGDLSKVRGIVQANLFALIGLERVDLDPLVLAAGRVFGQAFGFENAGPMAAIGVGGLPMKAPVVIDAIAITK